MHGAVGVAAIPESRQLLDRQVDTSLLVEQDSPDGAVPGQCPIRPNRTLDFPDY
jgi:hypothetical protein